MDKCIKGDDEGFQEGARKAVQMEFDEALAEIVR